MPIDEGTRLGRYEIRSKIGAGGMGEVYLAQDTKLGRRVAIKFLPAESAEDKHAIKRLIREAKAAAALDHQNICSIYEVGEEGDKSFIVMQFVEGETLDLRIKRKPYELKESLTIASQIADALVEAHEHAIIHRDIKPSNIMITSRGQAKVMDFGLARVIAGAAESEAETQNMLTRPGTIVGTMPYMSPEQVTGGSLDARSDIFSFGVVLYEMISGRQPFTSESAAATVSAILTHEPPPLARYASDVPEEFQRIVRKCLEKDRERRYQSARELLVDLGNLKRDAESGALLAGQLTTARRIVLLRRSKAIDSLAILPLTNASADPNLEYLSDGITENIINNLSQLPKLRVMARSTVFRYKGKDVDPQVIGRDLGVRAVMTGRVLQLGDSLIVGTEMVDVADGSQLWGEQYKRKLSDIFVVQEEIARQVSERLRIKLTGQEKKRLTKRHTEDIEAYQAYLKGCYYSKKWTPEGFKKEVEYFAEAIRIDPTYALAYAGLAGTYYRAATVYLPPGEAMPKAKAAAMKALELDDTVAEAHASMGLAKEYCDWDWLGAEREFKRAIELNPNNALGHLVYGAYLNEKGRLNEAILELKRAQQLDPLSLEINTMLALPFYCARQYDQSLAQLQKTIEMDPGYPQAYYFLGWVYEQKGEFAKAIAAYEKGLSLTPRLPLATAALGHALAISGKRDEARAVLDELNELSEHIYISPYDVAIVYIGLRENDQAFAWLEKAYDERSVWMVRLNFDRRLDSLRSDPRFTDLLRRVGFEP
ncbi:MAG TPA: protein kinase [Pyrinomonadaceae bacterium]|nr:protein kinase [Pyrinomonadaceae bacterium]